MKKQAMKLEPGDVVLRAVKNSDDEVTSRVPMLFLGKAHQPDSGVAVSLFLEGGALVWHHYGRERKVVVMERETMNGACFDDGHTH